MNLKKIIAVASILVLVACLLWLRIWLRRREISRRKKY
jgi:hypothetical protein